VQDSLLGKEIASSGRLLRDPGGTSDDGLPALCKSIDKGRLHNRARRPGLECFRLEYRMLKKGCGVNYIDEAA